MSEWWTYRLSDFLLFSPQTYYRLFELYNQSVWPVQLAAVASGAAMIVLVLRRPDWQGRAVTGILSAAWLWVAWAYHLQRYASINWMAPFFSVIFIAQAVLLIWTGVVRGRLHYGSVPPIALKAGLGMFVYALVIQPLMAPLMGRGWIQTELFGIAPDPTAIATLGLILLAAGGTFWYLLILPIVWGAISAATLWSMGSSDAAIVLLAVLTAVVATVLKGCSLKTESKS